MSRIFVIDDEAALGENIQRMLRASGAAISVFVDPAKGLAEALASPPDLVLLDVRMPGMSGEEVFTRLHESYPELPIVFLTAFGSVESAVLAMRNGAFDYLQKPFKREDLLLVVNRALSVSSLEHEVARLKGRLESLGEAEAAQSRSPAMLEQMEKCRRAAATDATVMILGESGTGKEVTARAIHSQSRRKGGPFVPVECSAMPGSLIESELFGYERGAFTGADKSRAGLFEAAHEGTLFLDEVAEMSLAAQAKLLRVLADGEIQRVGSTATRRVDVRVLAATHRKLDERVRDGLFREDLYYRLAVVPVHIAPLRQRQEDISELSLSLSRQIAGEMKVAARPISAAALEKLSGYAFPGNVRELKNLLERALILAQGPELQPDDFPLQPASFTAPQTTGELTPESLAARLPAQLDLRKTMTEIERALIVRSLQFANGVQAEAARYLGVSRSDLGYKIGKYSLHAPSDDLQLS